jgi:predicted nucleic acid-binding protein
MTQTTMTGLEVHPFRVDVPEEELVDLRRRVAATRWPDRETVTDQSQGVQLVKIQELVRYWGTDYDSLVIAAAIDAGCTRLYSENLQDGQRIEGLTVENPFREL